VPIEENRPSASATLKKVLFFLSRTMEYKFGKFLIIISYGTEDRGLESRQVVRFLGLETLQCRSL
jgi:hypothetical protein